MQIRFNHIQFTEIDYKVDSFNKEITHELETKLGVGTLFSDKKNNEFAVVLDVELTSKSNKFNLKIKSIAHFSTPDEINHDNRNSPFFEINAPAIAFPFVRTFISNLTLNSGYDPVVLPPFNFMQLAAEKKEIL
jgi:preprotein translocase subunit SecB